MAASVKLHLYYFRPFGRLGPDNVIKIQRLGWSELLAYFFRDILSRKRETKERPPSILFICVTISVLRPLCGLLDDIQMTTVKNFCVLLIKSEFQYIKKSDNIYK